MDSASLFGQVRARPSGNSSQVVRLNTQVTTGAGESVAVDGQTQFFRYNELMGRIIRHFMDGPSDRPLRFLFAPCSVGCEPYSFVALALEAGLFKKHPRTQIDALDICPDFVRLGASGAYTPEFFRHMNLQQASLLLTEPISLRNVFAAGAEGNLITLPDYIRERVRFLEPQPLADFRPPAPYDFVMNLNLLIYLEGQGLSDSTNNLARLCDGLLATNYSRALYCADMDYFSSQENREARRALADSGFVRVRDDTLGPVIDSPPYNRIPGPYAAFHRRLYSAVLLHSSDTRPQGGFAPFNSARRIANAIRRAGHTPPSV